MEYQTAIRGAFFDIAQVCDSADAIAQHARYLEDGLLFIQNGHILAHMAWQEGEQYLDPHKGYTDLRGKLLRQVGYEKYLFSDGTGEVLVEIDDELFLGRTVGEARPVELRGEVDSDFMETVEVEVDSLQLQALEH